MRLYTKAQEPGVGRYDILDAYVRDPDGRLGQVEDYRYRDGYVPAFYADVSYPDGSVITWPASALEWEGSA